MNRRNATCRSIIAATAAALLCACGGGGEASAGRPVEPQEFGNPNYGGPIGAEWWQWVESVPKSPVNEDPRLDMTGEYADVNQDGRFGSFWFLAGTYGGFAERSVTVPAAHFVFFPLVSAVAWGADPTVLPAQAAAQINGVDILECEVDGHSIPDLLSYRRASPVFALDPTRPTAVCDGYWMCLWPLSVGKHTIHFVGGTAGGVTNEVLYHVTVP